MPLHYLSTLFAGKSSQIRSYIKELSKVYSKNGHTILFALSSDFAHPEELQDIVQELRDFALGCKKGRLVGCLSGPVSDIHLPVQTGVNLSCAIAIFESKHCVPFYSSLSGRRDVQVGRWHSFREKENVQETMGDLEVGNGKSVDWEDVWNRKHSNTSTDVLPKQLLAIPPSKAHSIIYMSVPKPDLFTAAISNHFSSSTSSLGLIAAPTPFITNRAVTLFYDDKIYGDGSVGLALVQEQKAQEHRRSEVKTEFLGIQKLGEIRTVSHTEGNVVNTLDGLNPTRLLLDAIKGAGISSPLNAFRNSGEDDIFGLAVVSSTGEILQTYRITAGDPAHRGGGISLEASQAPLKGTQVQFIHRASITHVFLSDSLRPPTPPDPNISFFTVPEPHQLPSQTSSSLDSDSVLLLQNTFFATSSSGFIVSGGARLGQQTAKGKKTTIAPWSCTIPGALASLRWM